MSGDRWDLEIAVGGRKGIKEEHTCHGRPQSRARAALPAHAPKSVKPV